MAGADGLPLRKRDRLKRMAAVPYAVRTSDLPKRALSAVVMLAAAGGALWAGGLVLRGFIALVGLVGIAEAVRLIMRATANPAYRIAAIIVAILYIGLAAILLVPALATLWALWSKFQLPAPPAPLPLTATGLGAMLVNFSCAMLLVRFRHHSGSLTRAAFLSARNDVLANIAIIIAGAATAMTHAAWPDMVVGAGIMLMNADAAREVWQAARSEHREATGPHA